MNICAKCKRFHNSIVIRRWLCMHPQFARFSYLCGEYVDHPEDKDVRYAPGKDPSHCRYWEPRVPVWRQAWRRVFGRRIAALKREAEAEIAKCPPEVRG